MQKTPFKYEKAQKSLLISTVMNLTEEFNCDIAQIAEALNSKNVKKALSDQVHFDKYLCSPYRCKACKRKIPHDDPIFDNEPIYDIE